MDRRDGSRRSAGPAVVLAAVLLAAPSAAGRLETIVRMTDEGERLLYQLKFDEAERTFDALREAFPDHPAGITMLGAGLWWQARYRFRTPDRESTKLVDRRLREAIRLAERLVESEDRRCEGLFYLGGAMGVRAHWDLLQRRWLRAALGARKAVRVLREAGRCPVYADEVYFGLGLYQYVASSLPWHFRWLSRFIVGGSDLEGALAMLERAAERGRVIQRNARTTLVTIYTIYSRRPERALHHARALLEDLPDSPMARSLYVQSLAFAGRYASALEAARAGTARGLEAGSTFALERAAFRYYEGVALMGQRRLRAAESAFTRAIEGGGRTSWITAAYVKRGCVRDLLGERARARADYETALDRPDPWEQHKRAKAHLKRPFTWDRFEEEISPHGGYD